MDEFEKLEELHENIITTTEGNIITDYKKTLDYARKIMAEMFNKYEDDGKLTYEEMAKYNRLKTLQKMLDEITNDLYKDTSKNIDKALNLDYKAGYDGLKNIIEIKTGKIIIPIVKDEVLKLALYNDISGLKWTERMGIHRDYAVLKIRETVTQGLKEGMTYSQASQRLNDVMSRQVVNPLRIIRTESHRVFNQAKKDSLDKSAGKIKMIKTWISARDERVRTMHAIMDGVTIPYDKLFVLPDGSTGFAPGLTGSAKHDIHCRCAWKIDIL
ncbi:Phage Mu protein F like protein [Desulfonispora thiosulfatigenes DSM 11270]|uniref:Phage Mu protein F like protein n=1 Tax=Desulfonispora thiosulfatigenes DSM 11270 TaxID=656914 RepID=A0A1W1VQ03_DESTI|nr:phage minor head protein [Desulfonispora thiosulfatigenes]SMB95416.1 Phage Mu protein F like protein [Desulfonispora thiosulfatigenes DSM 11270]